MLEDADTSSEQSGLLPPVLSDFVYPPFDIDSFNDFLAREPTPQPTAAEVEAHNLIRLFIGQYY